MDSNTNSFGCSPKVLKADGTAKIVTVDMTGATLPVTLFARQHEKGDGQNVQNSLAVSP